MDRQTKWVIAAYVVIFGLMGLSLYFIVTSYPDVEPSPFDPPMPSPVATAVVTATPQHIPDAGNMADNLFVDANKNESEEWSLCDPRHNRTHLEYWRCEGCGGGGSGSAPQAAAQPIPEAETIAGVLCGIVAVVLMAYVRRN